MSAWRVFARIGAGAGVMGLACLGGASRASGGPRLQVSGTSHFDARAQASEGALAVSGTLLDDADRVVGHVPFTASFVAEDGAKLDPRPCHTDRAPAPDVAIGSATTDVDGTFCLRAPARPGTTKVTLSWTGTPLLRGAEMELAIDPARGVVLLAFDPEPRTLAIGDGPRVFDVVATLATGSPWVGTRGLTLQLSDERRARLGEAVTNADGHARFVVEESALGPPGPGELRLAFDGDAAHLAAQKVVACERRALVVVTPRVTAATDAGAEAADTMQPGDAEDEESIDLDIRTVLGEPVPSGSVEGLVDGAVAGVAPVSAGRAHLVVLTTLQASIASSLRLNARYVPEVPWYVAPAPLALRVAPHTALAWKRALVLVLGVFILGFFFFSRSRLFVLHRPREPGKVEDVVRDPTPRIDVIAAHAGGRAEWEGRVVDAHDGSVVVGAVVRLERPAFGSVEVIALAATDDAGRFMLAAVDSRAGDQFVAEGPLHGRIVRDAPVAGELQVSLVSRRRTLLRKLVEWARRRGVPFDSPPEPTPAHVKRMAGEDARTARWAGAVEDAAFGVPAVDSSLETEIERLRHEVERPEDSDVTRR